MLNCIKHTNCIHNTHRGILFLYWIRKNLVKLLSKHRLWSQKEFSAFFPNNLLRLKHQQTNAGQLLRSEAGLMQKDRKDMKPISVDQPHFTPLHTKEHYSLRSPIHTAAKWLQGESGNGLGFSLLSTVESSRKWRICNLKINLYKAQNCEGISSNCLCHCLDHKMFIP